MRWRKLAVNGLLIGSLYLLAAGVAILDSGKWAMIGPFFPRFGQAQLSIGVHEGWVCVDYNNGKYGPTSRPYEMRGSASVVHWMTRQTPAGRAWWFRIHPVAGIVLALVTLLYTLRARRRLGQRPVGYCPNCNYDLRATPTRCPECGWSAPTAREVEVPLVGTFHLGGNGKPATTFSTTPVAPSASTAPWSKERRTKMTSTRATLFTVLISIAATLLPTPPHARAADAPAPVFPNHWPDPKALAELDRKKPAYHYRESDVPKYTLPDPLLCADGTRITTAQQWEQKRRPETLELFRHNVYGHSPAPGDVSFQVLETDPTALECAATRKRIKITSTQQGKSFSFEAWVLTPNAAKGKVPAFLLINNRPVASADPTRKEKDGFWPAEEIIARGYATAVFRTVDVDPDKDGPDQRAKGVRGVWPMDDSNGDAWATIAAWAWGASRVLDYLQTDPAIDAAHVAVVGHSRGGKTALWAAAQDTRFALAGSNCSGRGGASLARRRMGETVTRINTAFPYWFATNYKKYNDREDNCPVDQHQLVALIAPRPVYVVDAELDFWADPRGEFTALTAATPVYALYNLPGPTTVNEMPPVATPLIRNHQAYHLHEGGHNLTPYDWNGYMNFADHLWRTPAR